MLFTTQIAARAFQPVPRVRPAAAPMRENHHGRHQVEQSAPRRVRYSLVLAITK